MKKLFFSALIALVAGSAAYASVGSNTLVDEVYYKPNEPNGACEEVPDCYNGPGLPCQVVTPSVYYIIDPILGCITAPQANFR